MCYAIPGKIVELRTKVAVVDYFGERRNVLNEFADVKIGDYVYAQGGILIQKIPQRQALEILDQWRELFFHLKELDLKIVHKEKPTISQDAEFIRIIQKANEAEPLAEAEMLRILKTRDRDEEELIYYTANAIRQRELKNSCCVHGIIEFSNYCQQDCFYCGLRSENTGLKRYRMKMDEIVELAQIAVGDYGFKALVLQSGDDYFYSQEMLVEIIRRIKQSCPVLIFVSVGERPPQVYKAMYEAGARAVLLRFETSNPDLYKGVHTSSRLDRRLDLLGYVSKLGYLVATGGLIGLPGRTDIDLVQDVLLARSLKVDMYSFGPFIPHPDTPLAQVPLVDVPKVLKVLSLIRFLEPQAKILVTTALETLDPSQGRRLGLLAGANSVMLNLTPDKYKRFYEIYPHRAGIDKDISTSIKETLDLLYSLGRAPTDLGI
jgi:biotin synthase